MKIYDVFISYRRSDGLAKAEALYRYLTEKGLRVFFDKCEMVDGSYFTEQIEAQLRIVPNYVLVATDDVFRFRQGEDWVRTEMQIALQMYEQMPADRSIVVLTEEQVQFPLKETLPAEVCKIADVQRVVSDDAQRQDADFERIFQAVTQVSHQNLWRAAHRWLENSKCAGGRFANLSIVESILPNAEQAPGLCDIPVNVSENPEGKGKVRALFDAVMDTKSHLFLIGQGGIGKTTALMYLMNETYVERTYSRNAQIPIFVELSFAPDVYDRLYEGGRSSFIRRSIYKQLRTDRTLQQVTEEEVSDIDEAFMLPYKVAVEPINDILSHTAPAPEYLLLLDGLNEVSSAFVEQANSTVIKMIAEEINMLMTRCPNVRVVLTSRSDEISVSDQPMARFYLSGVDKTAIRTYLQACGAKNIGRVMGNQALVQTLKTPLFLTLYGSLASREDVSTQGEIFRLFFNERRKNVSIYTVQDRLVELERNIYDTAGMNYRNRLTAPMQWFILDFLLPEIAWHMERKGEFYLRPNQIAQIIRPVLEDRSDIAVCGDFGKDLFAKYQQGSAADIHTQSVADDILQRLGPDISKCTEKIINCCTLALGILQRSGRKYGFVHQHIRDYFAALKNINTMRLALFMQEEQEHTLALACINTVLRDVPVGRSVREFIGQSLGEHHNRPVFRDGMYRDAVDASKEDRTLLSRVLDIYRGHFDGEGGYGQYTLLKILSQARGSLLGCDLSRLDLSGCQLNGPALGRGGLTAKLDGAKVRQQDLFFNGHKNAVYHFDISPDGSQMLTGTRDEVRIWDVQTGSLLSAYNRLWELEREQQPEEFDSIGKEIPLKDLICAQFIDTDTILLVIKGSSQSGVRIRKKDLILGADKEFFDPDLRVESVLLSADRTRLVLSVQRTWVSGCEVLVLNTADLQPVLNKSIEASAAHAVYITEDSRQMQIVYSEPKISKRYIADREDFLRAQKKSYLQTWDINSGTCIKTLPMKAWQNTGNKIVCNHKLFSIVRNTMPGIRPDYQSREYIVPAELLVSDLETGALLKRIPLPDSVFYQLVGGHTESVIAVVAAGHVYLYDTTDCQLLRDIWQRTFQVFFGPEDKTLALADTHGNLSVYEYPLMYLKTRLAGAGSGVGQDRVTFCADTKKVATITGLGDLRLWDAETARLIDERFIDRVYDGVLESSHDGKYLYYHGKNRSYVYQTSDLMYKNYKVGDLCIHPQGKYLAAMSGMGSCILDPEDFHTICTWYNRKVCAFVGEFAVVSEYKLIPNRAILNQKAYSYSLTLQNVQTDEICAVYITDMGERFREVAVSDRLLAAISSSSLYVWDLYTGEKIYQEEVSSMEKGSTLEFSGDGKYLLFYDGSLAGTNTVYETENFAEAKRLDEKWTKGFSSSPSGKLLLKRMNGSQAHDCLKIYMADTLSCAQVLPFSIDSNACAAISHDDRYLAAITNRLHLCALELPQEGQEELECKTIANIPKVAGLHVIGVDLRDLHPESILSEDTLKTLWHYGAIVDLP